MTEDGARRTEGGGQMTEDKGQLSEGRVKAIKSVSPESL